MDKITKQIELPLIPLRGVTAMANSATFLDISRSKSIAAIKAAEKNKGLIFLVPQKDSTITNPVPDDINEVGVIARVEHVMSVNKNVVRMLYHSVARARIIEYITLTPYISVTVEKEPYINQDAPVAILYAKSIKNKLAEYSEVSDKGSNIDESIIKQIKDINILGDAVVEALGFDDSYKYLEEIDTAERLKAILFTLCEEIKVAEMTRNIEKKVNERLSSSQKEYILREQIKVIHDELGDNGEEPDEYLEQLQEMIAPLEVKDKLEKDIKRLKRLNPSSAEYMVQATYIESVLELPWGIFTEDHLSISNARDVLNEDHYGLEKVKERILEHLAVSMLSKSKKGPIICLLGPPGVGKTSIGKSIARALGKNYVRLSFGGVRDEAEIRGHRKTYIGAMSGRIIKGIKEAGSVNPVFLLDEVDKLGNDMRGDPASAMLEVLDGEQNNTFRDHYLELPFDLSEVLFIATANTTDTIPRPLLDRMESIEMNGYMIEEKVNIARNHLLPKQLKKHGINESKVVISDEVFEKIINGYTYESGVRELERQIAGICRKIAMKYVDKGTQRKITLHKDKLKEFLGLGMDTKPSKVDKDESGAVTGLAWTQCGGNTLIIEVSLMAGSGDILLTGQLGDIMQESAKTAITLVRSRAKDFGLDPKIFKKTDIHIHVPEGAIQKDGPSAGITIATAVLSAFTGKTIKEDVAMTGEVTLRGKVLPIGGLKEKALAAVRAGIKTVIIPAENNKEMEDLPESIRKRLDFIIAADIDTVFKNSINGV